jgi:tyrosine-specific transport protein
MVKFSVLKLPTGQSRPLPYLLTLIPPLVLSLLDQEIFFKALDFAGTYGGTAVLCFFFVFSHFPLSQIHTNLA